MSGLGQNGHFAVSEGYFKKAALGNVEMEGFSSNSVRHPNFVF